MTRAEDLLRLVATPSDDCVLWQFAVNGAGYGALRWEGRTELAHRVAWKLHHGSWPGEQIDHECRIRRCVNVRHMVEIDAAGHGAKSSNDRWQETPPRSHCDRGHPLSGENLVNYADGSRCKQCRTDRQARYERSKATR